MKVYRSLNQFTKLTGDQIGEMIERYVNGEDLNPLAKDYGIYLETAKNYIHKHYYGIVPKHRQKTITISSKINEE